jgi:hypothetical protein
MAPADHSSEPPRRLTTWQVIKSTLAAALGVQSESARQRDFSHGSPATFIIAGFVFTGIFVVLLVLIVNLVLGAVT